MSFYIKRSMRCCCCGYSTEVFDWGLVSSFSALRIFGSKPFLTKLIRCSECHYAWSEFGLNDDNVVKLYKNYRDNLYFEIRNKYEPWYTRRHHDNLTSSKQMDIRREVLKVALSEAESIAGSRSAGIVLDHGGDKGQLLRDLPDDHKYVYDLSGVSVEVWAQSVDNLDEFKNRCDLVLSCQVLEHVNNPNLVLNKLIELVKPGGWLYVEVPFEVWKQSLFLRKQRYKWLSFISKLPILLMTFDFISILFRLNFKYLPFFCFWSFREHLNFFSHKSLRTIVEKNGLEIINIKNDSSGIILIARKGSEGK